MKKGIRKLFGIDVTEVEMEEGDLPEEYMTHKRERDVEFKEPLKGEVTLNLSSKIEEFLGYAGQMLRGTKQKLPGEDIYWNACIFDSKGVQIWFGDIDLNAKKDSLEEFGKTYGKIYVTPEHPYRWKGLKEGRKQAYRENEVREFG